MLLAMTHQSTLLPLALSLRRGAGGGFSSPGSAQSSRVSGGKQKGQAAEAASVGKGTGQILGSQPGRCGAGLGDWKRTAASINLASRGGGGFPPCLCFSRNQLDAYLQESSQCWKTQILAHKKVINKVSIVSPTSNYKEWWGRLWKRQNQS